MNCSSVFQSLTSISYGCTSTRPVTLLPKMKAAWMVGYVNLRTQAIHESLANLCKTILNIVYYSLPFCFFLLLVHFFIYTFFHSDPYARVAFANESQVTYMISQTPCPTWDQTLIFSNVEISEDPANVKRNPPSVVIELFDRDSPMVSCFAPIRKKGFTTI